MSRPVLSYYATVNLIYHSGDIRVNLPIETKVVDDDQIKFYLREFLREVGRQVNTLDRGSFEILVKKVSKRETRRLLTSLWDQVDAGIDLQAIDTEIDNMSLETFQSLVQTMLEQIPADILNLMPIRPRNPADF